MDEKLKSELRSEIWEICDILFTAQETLKLVEYLLEKEDDADKNFVKRSPYFQFQVEINWSTIVIQLCKLFSSNRNEQYNLYGFMNKFKEGSDFGDLKIDDNTILEWRKALSAEKDSIDNLILQRNKKFAHTDRDSRTVVATVTVKKARELVVIVQGIAREIYSKFFESSFLIDEPIGAPIEDLKRVISALAEERRNRLSGLRMMAKEHGLEDELD